MAADRFKHVLLDRDGVLNVERADIAVTGRATWRWVDGSLLALRRVLAAGLRVGVASNQSLVARGLASEAELDRLHQEVFAELDDGIDALDFVLYCPHPRDGTCSCRKPRPGMLHEAARRWKVDPGGILFIGDALTDFEASRAAGTGFALVRTGKGAQTEARLRTSGELGSIWGARAHADLAEVVDALLQGSTMGAA